MNYTDVSIQKATVGKTIFFRVMVGLRGFLPCYYIRLAFYASPLKSQMIWFLTDLKEKEKQFLSVSNFLHQSLQQTGHQRRKSYDTAEAPECIPFSGADLAWCRAA